MLVMKMNKRGLLIVRAICILASIVFVGVIVLQLYKTRSYIKTTATITSVVKTIDYGASSDSNTSITYHLHYQYSVDGQIFQGSHRVFFKFSKSVGDTINIYYNEENPEMRRDTFLINTGIIFTIIPLIFIIFITFGIKQQTH